jgi:hypothetical protein
MQVAIPVPKVPGPPISAPHEARDWNAFVPAPPNPAKAENALLERMEHVVPSLPGFAREAYWNAIKGINKIAFRSTPANPPVPEQPGSWKFSVLGDYGGGHSPQDEIATNVLRGKPDVLLTVGDNVYYNGLEEEFQKKWDPPQFFGRLREELAVRPSIGNHDVRKAPDVKPYFKRFPELDNARFYSFDQKGVHFVSLDSTESLEPGSPQLSWLDQDLGRSNADWKVLYFHHPLNPSSFRLGSNPNLGILAPLMAKHGVDLVLTGHEHNYQRTKPLNENGTIEVITGGGGQSLHPFVKKQQDFSAYRDVDFGHVEVEVTNDELVGRYIVRDGSVRDTFVIPNLTPGTPPAEARAETPVEAPVTA